MKRQHLHLSLYRNNLRSSNKILLERAQELSLLLRSLVRAVAELGGSVDPFQLDFFQRLARGVRVHGFAEGHDAFLDARDGALEEDEVVFDFAVVDEAAHPAERVSLFSPKKERGVV